MGGKDRCHGWRALTAAAALALSGCHGIKALSVEINTPDMAYRPSAVLIREPRGASFAPDVGVFADAHLNSDYGAGLFTGSLAADDLVRVAVRPPALNLWSPVVLSAFVREMASAIRRTSAEAGDGRAPLLLFLGDAVNVACTGELDRFVEAMRASAGGATWLMAPGNHESYMMGNFNGWGQRPNVDVYPGAEEFRRSGVDRIEDASRSDAQFTAAEGRMFAYWNATCAPSLLGHDQRSWAAACADPNHESLPMEKGTWIRRYLLALEDQGVRIDLVGQRRRERITAGLGGPIDPSRCAGPRAIEGIADDRTDLGRRRIWVTGRIYARRRIAPDAACAVPAADLNSYRSYIVQSLDLNERTRAVILDTDHHTSKIALDPVKRWAGVSAEIGDEQLADIARHAQRARDSGQRVVFFAHHPIRDLPEAVRARLLSFEPIAFVSAHMHAESSVVLQRVNGGHFVELNVGSITDWPMEAMLLETNDPRLRWRVLGVREPSTQWGGYQQVSWALGERACRARLGADRDYTAYKLAARRRRYHNLCLMREELAEIAPWWPGDRAPFRAVDEALGEGWSGTDALPPRTSFWPYAEIIASSVEALRAQAMREGSAERTFALCQAMAASAAEDETRGLTDGSIERADTLHPDRARPAASYTGADL